MAEKWTTLVKDELIKTLLSALEKLEKENQQLRDMLDNKSSAAAADEKLRDDVARLNAELFGDDYKSDRGTGGEGER